MKMRQLLVETAQSKQKQQVQDAHSCQRAEKQQLGGSGDADTIFDEQSGSRTGKQGLSNAVREGGQDTGTAVKPPKGCPDADRETQEPTCQIGRDAVLRQEKPDHEDGQQGGEQIIPKEEKLLAQAIQKTMERGFSIKQRAKEGEGCQKLAQSGTVVNDIADFLWKYSENCRCTKADDRGEKEGGRNSLADAFILLTEGKN